jgi:Zn-finger nucleic acid-binding protein
MQCPACSHLLSPINAAGLTTDICTQCGGLWFDRGELAQTLDTKKIVQHLSDESSFIFPPALGQTTPTERSCPHCHNPLEAMLCKGGDVRVTIDGCPTCRGFWLDKGELDTLARLQRNGQLQPMTAAMLAGGVASASILAEGAVAQGTLDYYALHPQHVYSEVQTAQFVGEIAFEGIGAAVSFLAGLFSGK